MPTTRITPKHQITIPREVFESANLEVGDILHAAVEGNKVVFVPKRLVDKAARLKLSPSEQRTLRRAQNKIKAINEDLLNSRGLTSKEIEVAVKVGLIPKDEAYSWTEEWQKDLRASMRDLRAGRVSGPFETAEELLADLDRLKQKT
jgi:bifunctional DNA-binding transcriptional regulator/antitoxin component of YhaV-PrlF toxin-antitoxin module